MVTAANNVRDLEFRIWGGMGRACVGVITSALRHDTSKIAIDLLSKNAFIASLVTNYYRKDKCNFGSPMTGPIADGCYIECGWAIPSSLTYKWSDGIKFFTDEVAARAAITAKTFREAFYLQPVPESLARCNSGEYCKAACQSAFQTPQYSDLSSILWWESLFSANSAAVAVASVSDTILGHLGLEGGNPVKESVRFAIGIGVASITAPILGGIATEAAISYALYRTITTGIRVATPYIEVSKNQTP